MLADPRIFIMDEATSSVDTITEKAKIQRGIAGIMEGRTSYSLLLTGFLQLSIAIEFLLSTAAGLWKMAAIMN